MVPGKHANRVSLIDTPLVTIDGATARDFDDAVFAEKRRGGWRLLVAIADVAHYVKPGSDLDHQRGRAGQQRLPAGPGHPHAAGGALERALLAEPEGGAAGHGLRHESESDRQGDGFEFYEAVIRSWQRLTYERVQEFLDEGALDVEPEVCHSLAELNSVYQAFRECQGSTRRPGL